MTARSDRRPDPGRFWAGRAGHLHLPQLLGDLALVVLATGTYTDLRRRIVPNLIVLPALAVAVMALPFTADWPDRLWAVGFVLLVYVLRAMLLRRPAGMGDAKLLLFLALALGFPALAASLGATCALALGFYGVQIARGRLSRADPIPLVPFIALGVGVAAIGQLVVDLWI